MEWEEGESFNRKLYKLTYILNVCSNNGFRGNSFPESS